MIDRISSANVQSMLEVLRSYQSQAAGGAGSTTEPAATKVGQPTFFDSVKNALDKVNDTDNKAGALSEAYDRGEEVPLTEVVLSMQKASLAFEATLQVRNKVMKAYEEIMNMPV
jgi:flagellar hook-basal body complex protein FliE